MTVNVAHAKSHLAQLIRVAQDGESVVITRYGKVVAQLFGPPQATGDVVLGGMKGRIKLLPGWDAPTDLDDFLNGDV